MPKPLQLLLCLLFLPLLIPLIIVALLVSAFKATLLYALVWAAWCPRGRNVLLVYSNSPIWHDYIVANIVPRLPRSTAMLNWSERRDWRAYRLPVMLVRFFGGSREFNPMIVVFLPFRHARVFRFWKAFQDRKHGNHQSLAAVERELFDFLSQSGIGRAEPPRQVDGSHAVGL
jgi:hypothetical protein